MATCGALSHFTYGELKEAHLTYGEIKALSDENFIKLMEVKLNRFSPKTPEQAKTKDVLIHLARDLALALTCDALKFIAKASLSNLWEAVLSLTQQ